MIAPEKFQRAKLGEEEERKVGDRGERRETDLAGDEGADAGAGAEEEGGELDAELVRADEGHGGRGRRHRTVRVVVLFSRRRRPRAEQSRADRVSKRTGWAGTRI